MNRIAMQKQPPIMGDLRYGKNQRGTLKLLLRLTTFTCAQHTVISNKTAHNSFLSAPLSVRETVSSLHLPKHNNQFYFVL